ncbi:MAG: 4Fe-4S binding protein [Nitratireductor sp.]|nr:4Fe-4S binding protein [Nitratireductor sp.]
MPKWFAIGRGVPRSAMTSAFCFVCAVFFALQISVAANAAAEPFSESDIASLIEPPYQLGESVSPGTWELVNLDGRLAGYAFETASHAPLPGFSGAPINMLVSITTEGKFIDVEILSHNEPIFVSGLGQKPFDEFVEQYKGLSINDSIVVGVPYGGKDQASSLVYLKGVTKATASVRIAHESIIGSAFDVARQKLAGIGRRVEASPRKTVSREWTWQELVEAGVATRRLVTNAEIDQAFAGSTWEDDDPVARQDPEGAFLDLWVVDIGPAEIAKAVLSPRGFANLQRFLEISPNDEPILVIDAARHGLVSEDFIRNTSPDLLSARQDGLPVALRDSDLDFSLAEGVPGNTALILRTDRRLGFDPTREWEMSVRAVRKHGSFMPLIGTVDLTAIHKTDAGFFDVVEPPVPLPPWQEAIRQRASDLVILVVFLATLFFILLVRMNRLAALSLYTPVRLAILAFVIAFAGWWGQGQLSIATVLGVGRSAIEGNSLAFLAYDPFSLTIWIFVLVSFVIWGRGFFCGWVCPFGAMQEFAHHAGRLLRLPVLSVPDPVDRVLVNFKYLVLAAMVGAMVFMPALNDTLIEIEPFKTAVTTYFLREWYYVAYAVGLLIVSMFVFKAFCRWICPLGAFMAIAGLLRRKDWIERRRECGSPCQLCRVRCNYGAIRKTGAIRYDECFQCLDCVRIHDDPGTCVPLVLERKGKTI